MEKINSGKLLEEEYRLVAIEFTRQVSNKVNGLFREKEKRDDYIIDYYKVETMRFFFGFPSCPLLLSAQAG